MSVTARSNIDPDTHEENKHTNDGTWVPIADNSEIAAIVDFKGVCGTISIIWEGDEGNNTTNNFSIQVVLWDDVVFFFFFKNEIFFIIAIIGLYELAFVLTSEEKEFFWLETRYNQSHVSGNNLHEHTHEVKQAERDDEFFRPAWLPDAKLNSSNGLTSLESKVGYDPTVQILFIKPGSVPKRSKCMPQDVGGSECYGAIACEWFFRGKTGELLLDIIKSL